MTLLTKAEKMCAKFTGLRLSLEKFAEKKLADRETNTHKKYWAAQHARIEGRHYERAARAAHALALSWLDGTIPDTLQAIKLKGELLAFTKKDVDTSGGYRQIRELDRWSDQSLLAIALRQYLEERQTAADQARVEREKKEERIRLLEADIKFAKIDGFFPTPPTVIERMLDAADIEYGMMVLEPSAGKGDIADAIVSRWNVASKPDSDHIRLTLMEINYQLYRVCVVKDHDCIQGDYLQTGDGPSWDRIIMNPPFENGQDMDHVRHAWEQLLPGGRIVAIMGEGGFFRNNSLSDLFRKWFEEVGGYSEKLEVGSFSDAFRPTGVSCRLVILNKPKRDK